VPYVTLVPKRHEAAFQIGLIYQMFMRCHSTQGTYVYDQETLVKCLDDLEIDLDWNHSIQDTSHAASKILACDFEGVSLGSIDGKVCLGQFATAQHSFLVDLIALSELAFTTKSQSGTTLKHILESTAITKVFCDPRADSVALYREYNIQMSTVKCVQLMHVAFQRSLGYSMDFLAGLHVIVASSLPDQAVAFGERKMKGRQFFEGNSSVWRTRPLPDILLDYATADVVILLDLYYYLTSQLNTYWMKLVDEQSRLRVLTYEQKDYYPQNRANAIAPKF
jgi:hypothetical protein